MSVDHTTIWRWTPVYGPEVHRRLRGNIKRKSSTWHVDETFVRIAGRWMYLFRAVDSSGQTVDFYLTETRDREAAKAFLRRALANPDNRPLHVLSRDGLRSSAVRHSPLRQIRLQPAPHLLCGQGANRNTTARFRRCIGDVAERPLLAGHDLRTPTPCSRDRQKYLFRLG